MFASTLNSSWDERSRRGLTTLTSFGVQALVVGVLLVLPLLRPIGLPSLRHLSDTGQPRSTTGEAPPVRARRQRRRRRASSNLADITLQTARLEFRLDTGQSMMVRHRLDRLVPTFPGALGPGSPDGVLDSLGTPAHARLCRSGAGRGCASGSHLAHERGRSGSQGSAGVSAAGAERAHSGDGRVAGGDQQARHMRI